jgi:hypothetical protein
VPAGAGETLSALVLANARFWPTVVPAMQAELRAWEAPAAAISDGRLRTLAQQKLTGERFNAEVAATLATLAPRPRRATAIRAIVALELLFDYLDGRTELVVEDPLAEGRRLFAPFIDAITAPGEDTKEAASGGGVVSGADWGYLCALSERTRSEMFALPAARTVSSVTRECARRCAEAQTRLHAAPALGDGQLRYWAQERGAASGLEWREYTAGCASSVLAMHALIAAASDPHTTEGHARRTDAAYLAIAAAITILDSIVDHAEDSARGQTGFVGLYEPGELPDRMRALVREALARCGEAPRGAHHAMTLAGVVAYYTSHPGARAPRARAVVLAARAELFPTIWPALAVMRGWRAAKRARRHLRRAAGVE